MPAWFVHQRISPRRTIDLGLIVDQPTQDAAQAMAAFIFDLCKDEIVLKPYH